MRRAPSPTSLRRLRLRSRRGAALAALLAVAGGAAIARASGTRAPLPSEGRDRLPLHLADTGLYDSAGRVAANAWPYTPQYPLWSDGARKHRWIHLPPGTAIDARDPDAWRFPVGTKLWKEFAFGRRVETRYMELGEDGAWAFATYAWTEDGHDAVLAPASGVPAAIEIRPGLSHDIPARADCLACHGGRATPVLGFGALQLSSDRDSLAPHAERPDPDAVDLEALLARGLVVGLPPAVAARPPRIEASTPRGRAALGYLHANCGSCHATGGPLAPLDLGLEHRLGALDAPPSALETTIGRASRFRIPTAAGAVDVRLVPGDPARSVLWRRVASRNPLVQMPPLGTHAVDEDARALLEGWIRDDLAAPPSVPVPSPSPSKE